ncbi:hypothetical protein [Tahibacter harae]|uniref:Uncharacterized protein n=1 Tax=Tahibacter harae TaxID=2963937 RepID=A0ABT1QQK5_9GAMM|nr:hypothetical protein [Tahibacter harae]MCQ4164579.1 hypothetical protein [Tahibacter harae]
MNSWRSAGAGCAGFHLQTVEMKKCKSFCVSRVVLRPVSPDVFFAPRKGTFMNIASRIKWRAQRVALAVPLGLAGLVHAQQIPLETPDVALIDLGEIQSMDWQPHHGLLLAGSFTQFEGFSRNGLARLNGAVLDTAWDPAPIWLGPVPTVPRRVKMAPDGGIFVSGDLVQINGQAVDCIVKLKPDGTLDTAWTAPTTNCDFDPVFDRRGWMYYIESNGSVRRTRLDIGGSADANWQHPSMQGSPAKKLLLEFGGSLYAASQNNGWENSISKISTSGDGLQSVWSKRDEVNSDVVALQQSENGVLYVGHANGLIRGFDVTNGGTLFSWQTAPGLRDMKIDSSGRFYVAAAGGVKKYASMHGSLLESYDQALSERVNQLWPNNGELLIGGKFSAIGGYSSQSFIVVAPGLPGLPHSYEITGNGTIDGVAPQPNGGTIVYGDFIKAGKLPRQHMFRLTPAGDVDPDWSTILDGAVTNVVVGSDNSVYIGGPFASVYTAPTNFLAKLNGSTGAPDFSWMPTLSLDAPPPDLAIDTQDRIYVPQAPYGVRRVLQPSGATDPNWNLPMSVAEGVDVIGDYLYVRHRMPGEQYQISLDRFALADGEFSPFTWRAFVYRDRGDVQINSVTADAVGDILVGGHFNGIFTNSGEGGANLVRLSAASATPDTTWLPAVNGPVDAIDVDAAGEIYVAGRFSTVNAQPSHGLVKLSPLDASLRTEWVAPHGAEAICVADAQRLFVVGQYWPNTFVALSLLPSGVTAIEVP